MLNTSATFVFPKKWQERDEALLVLYEKKKGAETFMEVVSVQPWNVLGRSGLGGYRDYIPK